MKKRYIIILCSFFLSNLLLANCTLSGPVRTSNDPFSACSGTITINGDLIIDSDYDVSGLGDLALIINNGTVSFEGDHNLILSSGSTFELQGTAQLSTEAPCNSNQVIYLGLVKVTSCDGTGAMHSFAQVNSAGGFNSAGVLPVEFTAFFAKTNSENIELVWHTATETNNDYFSIEHSTDGQSFQSIGSLKGQGFSTENSEYTFVHKNPAETNYYRLKQVDFDGAFEYSKTIFARWGDKSSMGISPNPTKGQFVITGLDQDFDANVKLFNLSGQLLKQWQVAAGSDLNTVGLEPGVYLLQITQGNNQLVERLIVQ